MESLALAHRIKEDRRRFLREVKAQRASVVAVLRSGEVPDFLQRCSMHKLITAYRNFPEKRFQRIMDDAGAGWARLVGEMTERQLAIVLRDLEAWEKAHPVVDEVSA